MESDQISIEQLNISFGEIELHDSEARVEQAGETLSDLWQSFRTARGEEDAIESRTRTDNGRGKQLTIPKLSIRRNSGPSLSGNSKSDPPIHGRRSSMPRCGSPGLRERRASESRKLLSIEKFVTFQEENGRRTNISHGKGKDASLTYSTQPTPGGEHTDLLVNPLDSAGKRYELTRRSKSGFPNESLPALDKARTRRFSAPSSPSSFVRKGKYVGAKPPQIQTDTLLPPARKKTLSPLSSEETLPRGSDTSMVFPKNRQEKGHFSADSNSYICPTDFKIPLGTKLAEQLESELSLIKGQNAIDKKKSRYGLTTQPFQDIPAEGMSNAERKQEETSLPRRSLRSSNQTVHYTNTDMFDPMFES